MYGSPATMASTGPRYFGFVTGAILPPPSPARGSPRVGPERRAAGHVARRGQAARRRARLARRPARAAGRTPGSRSSPARRWPTRVPRRGAGRPPRRPRLGRAGRRAVRCTRLSVVVSASGRTRRWRSRSGSSGSAATGSPSSRPTTRAGCAPTACPTSTVPFWSAPRRARSTRVPSTRSTTSPTGWRRGRVGCTSTGRSDCGRSPTRAGPTLVAVSTAPTPGPPTGTSGSTSPTTAASPSSAGLPTCAARSLRRPATCRSRCLRGDAPHAAVLATGPPDRGVGGVAHARPRRVCGTSSSARAPRRGDIADRLRAGGCDVLNDVVLNQVLVALRRRPDHRGADRRGAGRRAVWCGPTLWDGADGDADQRLVVEHQPTMPSSRPT